MSPLLRETEGPTKSQAARKLTKLTHDKLTGSCFLFLYSPRLRGWEYREPLFEDEGAQDRVNL